jgi:integrase
MQIKVRHKFLRDGKRRTVYLDFYERGRRRLEYLGLYLTGNRVQDKETLRLAENIAAKRRLEFANDQHGFVMATKQEADCVAYCRKLGESKRVLNTRLVWKNAVNQLEAFSGGPVQFSRVNHSFLEAFKEYLLKDLNPNSAGVYLSRIKTACRQAVKDGILPRNPAADISIKKRRTRREYLTLEELQRLAQTPCSNEETKQAFLFSAFTGLRYSDVRALTWQKVRPANGSFVLEFTQVKTGDVETLPMSDQAVAILREQTNAKVSPRIVSEVAPGVVFRLGAQQSIDKALRQWVKRAGIEKRISFHCARHTFATLGLTCGVDLYTMSKLLGHRDIASTQIYAKIIDKKKLEAVAMLPTLQAPLKD